MNECRKYAQSLINNLSLMSGLILVPSEVQIAVICQCLKSLRSKGFTLDDYHMKQLIYGSDRLNADPDFNKLKRLINQIKIKTTN